MCPTSLAARRPQESHLYWDLMHNTVSMNINNSAARIINSGYGSVYSKALMKQGQALFNSALQLCSFRFLCMIKHLCYAICVALSFVYI